MENFIFCAVMFIPFHATGLFIYPMKISEKLWFSDVLRGYRK